MKQLNLRSDGDLMGYEGISAVATSRECKDAIMDFLRAYLKPIAPGGQAHCVFYILQVTSGAIS
jgi:hypothetical protein